MQMAATMASLRNSGVQSQINERKSDNFGRVIKVQWGDSRGLAERRKSRRDWKRSRDRKPESKWRYISNEHWHDADYKMLTFGMNPSSSLALLLHVRSR